jgi:Protein of unknown function (DUF3392)
MNQITTFLQQHLHDIATAIIATLLVIFGGDINRFIKRMIKKNHFIVRIGVFVLVCAIGYGIATLYLADFLLKMLAAIPRQFLTLGVAATFIVLGLIAESRKQI